MKQVILAISGRKAAGKNTIANYIAHYYYSRYVLEKNEGEIGVTQPSSMQVEEAESSCLLCSFADDLKEFCINVLGLTHEQCYGTDEEKSTPTRYLWDDIPLHIQTRFEKHTGPMHGRDVMQVMGTDLIRDTFGNVWTESTIRRIQRKGKEISLVCDNRFPNEIEAILKQEYGYLLRLTRSPFGTKDKHPSEAALDIFNWNRDKCFVIDNVNLTIEEQNAEVIGLIGKII